MKKTLPILCALCLLLTMAGCVQTPEQPLVAQKDVDRLIEMAQQTPNGNALSDLSEKTPGDYHWETTAFQNRIKVNVDAKVILPDRDAAPMYRVTAGALTDEQTRAITDYLFGDTPVYEMPQDRPVLLKSDVQWEINQLELALQEGMENHVFQEQVFQCKQLYYGLGMSEEEIDQAAEHNARDEIRKRIGSLRDMLPGAVDSYEGIVSRGNGNMTNSDSGSYRFLDLRSESGEELIITSAEKNQSTWTDLLWVRYGAPMYNLATATDPPQTQEYENAKALAEGLFAAAGLEVSCFSAWQVDDSAPEGRFLGLKGQGWDEHPPVSAEHTGYVFYFTTAVDGLSSAWSPLGGNTGTGEKGQEVFEAGWPYEMAYVVVDEDGIAGAFWCSPCTEKVPVSENCPLLSFDQACEVFESMVTVPYEGTLSTHDAVGWNVPNDTFELSITEVRLELIRSRAAGGERTGLLIPAWVFYGTVGGTATLGGSGFFPDIILAINAVDGTILDVEKGY
ncbi:MAG: hypothetical protein J5878_00685 [Oscillospiraceae bacterium]|nr:hypothetical protein [Oscillospiraceae bacterium]